MLSLSVRKPRASKNPDDKSARNTIMTYLTSRKSWQNITLPKAMNKVKNCILAAALFFSSFRTGIANPSTSFPNYYVVFHFHFLNAGVQQSFNLHL